MSPGLNNQCSHSKWAEIKKTQQLIYLAEATPSHALSCLNTLCDRHRNVGCISACICSLWSSAVFLDRAQTHREEQSNGEEGGQPALQPPHGVLSGQSFLRGRQEAQAATRNGQEDEGRASEEGIRHSKCESKNSSEMENLHKAPFGTDFTISQQNCHKMLMKIDPLILCSF